MPPVSIAATPASKAFPPRVRISNAEAVVSGWAAETPPLRPMTGGRPAARALALASAARKLSLRQKRSITLGLPGEAQ